MKIIIDEANGDCQSAIDRDLELLLQASEDFQSPILRCWKNQQCLVIGKQVTRWPGFEQAAKVMATQGWPVIVRATGGTVVPHYDGVLNVSYIYPVFSTAKSFHQAYKKLCVPLIAALNESGVYASTGPAPGAYCDGEFNIIVDNCKLAGTAQRWKKIRDQRVAEGNLALVHASLNLANSEIGVAAVQKFFSLMDGRHTNTEIDEKAHTDLCALLGRRDIALQPLIETIVWSFSGKNF